MVALSKLLGLLCSFTICLPAFSQSYTIHDEDRSFRKMQENLRKHYEGTPVKGNHKRAKRALHYWERRLDSHGNIFNHVRANMEALQQLYIDTFPGQIQGNWQQIGPVNSIGNDYNQEGLGRVNQIYIASPTTWYAGTAGGGLWRTDVGGFWLGGPYPWYPLTDSLPVLSISGIAVHPNDVDDIYILTGDGESQTYSIRGTQPGIGILHSTDGGITWDPTAFQYDVTQLQAGYKLLRYPGSIDTMFAACTDGLFRTSNGWTSIPSQPIGITCYDIEFKPDDPQVIYAACQGALQRSTNGGITFNDISANLVQTNLNMNTIGRMAIAVTPDEPDILYVIIAQSNGGLMSFQVSYDGGDSFIETITNSYNILAANEVTESDGQGNYDLAIWADPGNAQTVIVGGVNLWKSITGGILWVELANWTNEPPEYTHADIHAIETNPFSGDIVVGSDGGLYVSSDGGLEWVNYGRGLGITQYYHLDVWTEVLGLPFIAGGAQDNGTSIGYGFSDPAFSMIGGGDGFRTYRGSPDGDPMRYRSAQNGKLYWQTYVFDDFWDEELITPEQELDGNDQGLGAWDTPYQPNPNNFNELIAGYGELYYSGTNGEDWLQMNYPDGFSYDGSRLITQLEWSKVNGNVVFFFVSDNNDRHLYKCETFYAGVVTGSLEFATCTIQDLDTIDIMPPGDSIQGTLLDIVLSTQNTDEVWISFAGYSDSMKVFYNPDMAAGAPWINISYNLPNTPVHCLEWDVDGLFAGTDIGAFYLPHGEEAWIYFSKGLPTVAVTEIEVRNTLLGKAVFASTWGRGIWWSTPPTPIRRTRWYVDDSAMGLGTGASWTNALTNLQTALDTVLAGDSIWVAAGTYFPETTNGFHLSQSDVFIWGGFNGTEDSVAQRDFVLNETILSGDLGVLDDSLDNANHVFVFGGYNGNVLLDGFHITEGYAKNNGENSNGGGIYYSTGLQTGKPFIANCRIYNNSTFGGAGYPNHIGYGAGMYIADYATGDPYMRIKHCTFENNFARNRGGGLCIDVSKTSFPQDTGTTVVYLDSCVFLNNVAEYEGGGIYLDAARKSVVKLYLDSVIFDDNRLNYFQGTGGGISGDANPGSGTIFLDCNNTIFRNQAINTTYADGGAVYLNGNGGTTESIYTGCLFENNQAGEGGVLYHYAPGSTSVSSLSFDDCIITNNSGQAGGAFFFNSTVGGTTEVNMNLSTFSENSAAGRAGALYFNADNGGNFSVSVNTCTFLDNTAGENAAMRFYSRSQTSTLGITDATISNSYFQNNVSTGSIYGGAIVFWSDRSIMTTNITGTHFSDNVGGAGGGALAHYHLPGTGSMMSANYANCTFIDNSVASSGLATGGALYLLRTNGEFDNCTFTGNSADVGGAIGHITEAYDTQYLASYTDCDFIQNSAIENGGAIYNRHNSTSTLATHFISCDFDSNYTTLVSQGRGGAIYTTGTGRSEEYYFGSDFTDNSAPADGGAIYITNNLSTVDSLFFEVEDCTFTNNDAGVGGETIEIFGNGSSAKIFTRWNNCDFLNDEPDVIFRNRKTGGIVRTVMNDCNILLQNEAQEIQSMPLDVFLLSRALRQFRF